MANSFPKGLNSCEFSYGVLRRTCLVALMLAGSTDVAPAEVRPSSVISPHAVLQRDANVPVWGLADPGEQVTVTFADRTQETTADRFGRWRVELDPMPASSQGRSLLIVGPSNTVEVTDVVVGDAWMYLTMSFHLNDRAEWRAAEPHSDDLPSIRFYRPTDLFEIRTHSRRPQAEFPSGRVYGWGVYKTPGKYFPNDAWYLGMGLGRESNVPVGVLGLGASTLDAMIPPAGYIVHRGQLGEQAEKVATWVPHTPEGREAYLDCIDRIKRWEADIRGKLEREDVTFADLSQPPLLPGPPAFERAETTHYNNVIHRVTPAAIRGLIIQTEARSVGDPQYAVKLAALVEGLRQVTGRRETPICVVQMHSPDQYERNETDRPEDWIDLRAAQTDLMRADRFVTTLATYDIDPKQRHALPMERALRVSQWAAAVVRGEEVTTGPVVQTHRFEGNTCRMTFDSVGRGLTVGVKRLGRPIEPAGDVALAGFEIADEESQWHPAEAVIDGDSVIATCKTVAKSAGIRYAWSMEPSGANLCNRDGFPALPFAR